MNYDEEKWRKALSACQSALKEAESAGHRLFTLQQSEQLREQQKVGFPFVPDKPLTGSDAEKNEDFLKRVMLMRYMVTTRVNEGNTETIWGLARTKAITWWRHYLTAPSRTTRALGKADTRELPLH